MQDSDCLVFVEVRFRSGNRITSAALTVDVAKQRRIIRTAALFLAGRPRFANAMVRFDVVGIDTDDRGHRVDWIQDAFRPADSDL
jgi:putative endonuclease